MLKSSHLVLHADRVQKEAGNIHIIALLENVERAFMESASDSKMWRFKKRLTARFPVFHEPTSTFEEGQGHLWWYVFVRQSYIRLAEVTLGMTGKDPGMCAALDRFPTGAVCATTIFAPLVTSCFSLFSAAVTMLLQIDG